MDATQKRIENFKKVERFPVTSPDQLKSSLPRALYAWWQTFLPELPSRANFDITKHRELVSNIFLIEVVGDGHFLYRLHGERVTQLVGRSNHNTRFSAESSLLDDRLLAEHLHNVITARAAYHCFGNLSMFDREFIQFESLDCPLADAEGNITHILGVLVDIQEGDL
ncbi:MAG: PAS domain-containing protein [Sneathiella sp.]